MKKGNFYDNNRGNSFYFLFIITHYNIMHHIYFLPYYLYLMRSKKLLLTFRFINHHHVLYFLHLEIYRRDILISLVSYRTYFLKIEYKYIFTEVYLKKIIFSFSCYHKTFNIYLPNSSSSTFKYSSISSLATHACSITSEFNSIGGSSVCPHTCDL